MAVNHSTTASICPYGSYTAASSNQLLINYLYALTGYILVLVSYEQQRNWFFTSSLGNKYSGLRENYVRINFYYIIVPFPLYNFISSQLIKLVLRQYDNIFKNITSTEIKNSRLKWD